MVVVIVMLGIVISTLDSTIVNVSLEPIAVDLALASSEVAWVALAYTATLAAVVMFVGRLADQIGYRATYRMGFATLAIGSVLCALSGSLSALIVSRCIQALGGAGILAVGSALLVRSFPPEQRGRALAAIPVGVSLGITAGPVLGGVLNEHLSWHWIFWINVPLCAVGFVMAQWWLHPVAERVPLLRALRGLRWSSVGLVMVACASLFVASSLASGEFDVERWVPAVFFGGSLVAAGALIRSDRKQANPLLPYLTLRNPVFTYSLMSGVVSMVLIGGHLFLLPFFMRRMMQLSELNTGLVLVTAPACLIAAGPIAGWLSDRLKRGELLRVVSLLVTCAGYIYASRMTESSSISEPVTALIMIATGMGLFQTPNNHVTMNQVPRDSLASTNSFIASARILGMATGTSVASLALGIGLVAYMENPPADVRELNPDPGALRAFSAGFILLAALTCVSALLSALASLSAQKRLR